MHTTTNQKSLGEIAGISLFLLLLTTSSVLGQVLNRPATMDQPDDLFIGRNAGPQSIPLSNISDNEIWFIDQLIEISAESNNPGLIQNLTVNYTSPNETGSVTFDPAPNTSGQAIITITVEDIDGGNKYDVLVVVNDPPVVDIPDQEIAEGTPEFTIILDNFVSDPDTGDEFITWTYSGNNELSVEIDNDTRVATITPPDLNWNGSETITFTANDNVEHYPGEGSDDVLFTVTPVNDAPVLANIETGNLEYTEGDDPVTITSQITVTDIDNNNLASAVVSITANFNQDEDVLSFTDANGITGSYNQDEGVLELTGASSLANYQSALRSVTYHNSNTGNPDTETRTVSFRVSDGEDNSEAVTRNIVVIDINSAPELSNMESDPLVFTEGDDPVIITSSLVVADPDNTNLVSARIAISGFVSSEDVLSFTNANGISGSFDASEGVLSLTGTTSIANYQQALRSIRYHNTNTINPNTTTRTISFTVNDGADNSDPATREIDVIAVNSLPQLAGIETDPIEFTEGDDPVTITSSITVSDEDNSTLLSATITIAANRVSAEDVLAFTEANGITGVFNAAAGVLELTGQASLSAYEEALRSVTYQNTNDANPSAATRTIAFIVNDGTDNSNTLIREINIIAVNDPPVAADANATLPEDSEYTFSSNKFSENYSDPEGTAFNSIKITSLPDKGSLTYNGNAASANLEIPAGNIAQLKYTPELNGYGTPYTTFKFQVRDGEGTFSTDYTFTLNVTPIADTPQVTNASTNEGEQTTSGLVISRNTADGNEVTHFKIINIQRGKLYKNNGTTEISNNEFITFAEGNAGLKFTPNSPDNASFEIRASKSNNDAGLGGGVAIATIFVNSRPTTRGISNITVLEDAPDYTLNLADFFEDKEDEDEELTFAVTGNSNPDIFNAVTISGTILTFELKPDANGSSSITLRCTDTNGAFVDEQFTFTITPVNDPPSFTLSENPVELEENFNGNVFVDVIPGSVPEDEEGQTVTYSINPTSGNFVDITINQSTGRIRLRSLPNQAGSQTFEVIANDGLASNNIFKRNLTVNVGAVNSPPVFSLSGDVTANEDFTGTRTVTVTPATVPDDEQNQTVTYSLSPSIVNFVNISFNQSTGNVEFTSIPNRFGMQIFTITADDGQSENNTYSEQFTLTINPVNDPPTLDDIEDIYLPEGAGQQEVALTGISAGPFETEASQFPLKIFAFSGNTNNIPNPSVIPSDILTSSQTTATLRFTPNANAAGPTEIQVLVVDAGQQSVTKKFIVSIADRNDPPYFDEIASPITIDEDAGLQAITITGINAGPDEVQGLAFTVSSGNEVLIDNAEIEYSSPASVATLTFSPKPDANGSAILTITLTDDGPSDGDHENTFSREIEIVVNPVNDPPLIASTPNEFATSDNEYVYDIIVEDPDEGDEISINATFPDWLTFTDNGDGTATLSGTPTVDEIGIYDINIEAEDLEGASDVQSFTLQVIKENKLPVFTSEPVELAAETFPYAYSVSVDDEDVEDLLTITAVQKPEWLSLVSNASRSAILNGRPLQGDAGDYEITLKVTDSRGASAEQSFVLKVLPFSQALQLTIEEDDLYYEFGEDSVILNNTAEIFNFEGDFLTGARIIIRENYVPGVDSLSAIFSGSITGSFRNGELTLMGDEPIAVYEQVLSSIYYHNKNNPDPASAKVISFQVFNINLRSNTPTRTVLFEEIVTLDIPSGFTPNSDGNNDEWVIDNLSSETLVQVYARNGNKIYESPDYYQSQIDGKAWNGTDTNGKNLPSGVYYYFIDYKKYGTTYKGTVTILK